MKKDINLWKAVSILLIFFLAVLSSYIIYERTHVVYKFNGDYSISKAELDQMFELSGNETVNLCKKGVDYCFVISKLK